MPRDTRDIPDRPTPPKDADFSHWTRSALENLRADVEEALAWNVTQEILELEEKARALRRKYGIKRVRSFRGKTIS